MIGCFVDQPTQLAACVVNDVLTRQGRSALDPVSGEEPAEELDPWGSEVAPNEPVGGALMVIAGGGSVDESGHQPVAPILEVAGPFIGFVCQHHVLQHQGELLELFCRPGGQAVLELVAEHGADDVSINYNNPMYNLDCNNLLVIKEALGSSELLDYPIMGLL